MGSTLRETYEYRQRFVADHRELMPMREVPLPGRVANPPHRAKRPRLGLKGSGRVIVHSSSAPYGRKLPRRDEHAALRCPSWSRPKTGPVHAGQSRALAESTLLATPIRSLPEPARVLHQVARERRPVLRRDILEMSHPSSKALVQRTARIPSTCGSSSFNGRPGACPRTRLSVKAGSIVRPRTVQATFPSETYPLSRSSQAARKLLLRNP